MLVKFLTNEKSLCQYILALQSLNGIVWYIWRVWRELPKLVTSSLMAPMNKRYSSVLCGNSLYRRNLLAVEKDDVRHQTIVCRLKFKPLVRWTEISGRWWCSAGWQSFSGSLWHRDSALERPHLQQTYRDISRFATHETLLAASAIGVSCELWRIRFWIWEPSSYRHRKRKSHWSYFEDKLSHTRIDSILLSVSQRKWNASNWFWKEENFYFEFDDSKIWTKKSILMINKGLE